MLNGEYGEVIRKCMEILVKIGDIYNADKLIPIESAQIAGVSYLTVGDAIFSFFRMLTKEPVKVKVPTWLNPAGMDMRQWKYMNINEQFANKQLKIINTYKKLGIETTLSCTPYLIGKIPKQGSHLAWSESSAIAMANSYFGAKTNREGGPSSLAAAITGLTANYGLHIDENRNPIVYVKVESELNTYSDFALLGYWYGEKFHGKIPLFSGINDFSVIPAKYLSSAIAASGSVALYHVEGKTPESKEVSKQYVEESIVFDDIERKEVIEKLQTRLKEIELVVIGCPHVGIEELDLILSYCKDKELKKGTKLWVFMARALMERKEVAERIRKLAEKNIRIFSDTCMVVSPAIRENFTKIATNSAKAYFYLSMVENMEVVFLSLKEILEQICK